MSPKKKINIWLVQRAESLPGTSGARKMRTATLAEALIERGHSVTWWTSAFDHFEKKWRFDRDAEVCTREHLKIKALKGIGYKKNISLSRLIDHRIIARKFKRLACGMNKPDIIIASLPSHDLAYEAVSFARKHSVPILVDIRDPWPDLFIDHVPKIFKKLARLVLYKDFRDVKNTMKMADGIVAVTNAFLEWGLKYARRRKGWKDRVFYLGGQGNCAKAVQQGKFDKFKDKFVVLFIGTFSHYHDPSILLDCAAKLKNNDIQFVVAGNGQFFESIEKKSRELENVCLAGWVEDKEIEELLSIASVGICPSRENSTLFPNKAFSYLSAAVPIISSFNGDLQEIVEKEGVGLYYSAGDAEELAGCVRRFYEDSSLLNDMSKKAGELFKNKFDSKDIYKKYADHIEHVAAN